MNQESNKGFPREWGAGIIAATVAVAFAFFSFYNTDAEVYLFPRIIAVCIAVLAVFQCVSTFRNVDGSVDQKRVSFDWVSLLPGLAVGLIFVLSLEVVGFYTCSFIAFFAIVSLYGKRSAFDPKALVYKLVVSTIFTAILYGLFWKLLYVRTPTGWFF